MKLSGLHWLGWVSGLLLAWCGLPEAYRAVTAADYWIDPVFLIMWGLGEVGLLIVAVCEIKKPYLVVNYGLNLIFILVMVSRLLYDWGIS